MKSAILATAAMCICPPAIVAATAVAVHHAPHHAPRRHYALAHAPHRNVASRPEATPAVVARPCEGTIQRVADVYTPSYLNNIEVPPFQINTIGRPGGGGGVIGPGPGRRGTDVVGGVPEPAAWLMMILGFGAIGGLLRLRKDYVPAPAGARASRRSRVGGVARTFAVVDAVLSPGVAGVTAAAQTSKLAVLAQAAMCVCPPAVVAMTAIVHPTPAVTRPAITAPHNRFIPAVAPVPCLPNTGSLVADLIQAAPKDADAPQAAALAEIRSEHSPVEIASAE